MSDEMNEKAEGSLEEDLQHEGQEAQGGEGDGHRGPTGPNYGIFESLRVYPVPSTTSKVAGYVSCKIKTELGYIFLNSMALVWGNNGLFLSFPSRKKENSPRGHEDYYFFEREMREKLQEHAIMEYKNKGGNMVQPMLPQGLQQQPPMGQGMGRQPYGGAPAQPRYNNGGGYGGGGGYGNQGYGNGSYGPPQRYNNGGGGYGGGGYGNQGGYGNNYGNGYGNGNYGQPRRPMQGGYDNQGMPPRRPMSSGNDYTQRPPRNYDRPPQRPPRAPEGGEFGTTPIRDDEE